jgi:hypothetical protein
MQVERVETRLETGQYAGKISYCTEIHMVIPLGVKYFFAENRINTGFQPHKHVLKIVPK